MTLLQKAQVVADEHRFARIKTDFSPEFLCASAPLRLRGRIFPFCSGIINPEEVDDAHTQNNKKFGRDQAAGYPQSAQI